MKRVITACVLVLVGVGIPLVNSRLTPAAHPNQFGWIADPAAVAAVNLPIGFADTPAFREPYTGPDDVYLWDAARKATGDVLPARDQGPVGACVGFGAAAAVEHLICVQIANGAREEFRPVSPEVIYAGSRVEIGGGRVRGDGSIGAWAARFVSEFGVLPRGFYGRLDLTVYDPARCRQLGVTGVPDDLEPRLKDHPVRSVANVRSWDECRAAVRNGYPVLVCSSQGFTMTRDADGACRPSGTWMHAMAVIGVRGEPRPGAFLLNSWGPNAHRGPRVPADAPVAGFWADAAVIDRMLRQGDSWAFSRFAGFPSRKLDWYALNQCRMPNDPPMTKGMTNRRNPNDEG
jgi:hypothetical protein